MLGFNKKYHTQFLAILVTLFSLNIWAEEVHIQLGFGSVKLTVPQGSKIPVDKLETEILINEDLAQLVLQKKYTEKPIRIEPGSLAEQLDEVLDQLEPEMEEVVDQLRAQTDPLADVGGPQDSLRVNVGSREEITQGERVSEVVVVGGHLDVYGEVEELVVMGGKVILHPTAVVTKELVLLGGDLETKQGARIEGSNVQLNFSVFNKGWPLFWKHFSEDTWDENFFTRTVSIYWLLFQWLFLLLLAWIEKTFAPLFKGRVQTVLEKSLLSCGLWGVGGTVAHLLLLVLLAISLVGIPLIPVYFALVFVFYMMGVIHMARFVGDKLLKGNTLLFAGILAGILSLDILPGFGYLLKMGVFMLGYGAVLKVFLQSIMASKPAPSKV